MEALTVLSISALCAWACHEIAENRDWDTTLGCVIGFFFGLLGLIVYGILAMAKKDDQSD